MKIPSRDIHKTSSLSTVTPEKDDILIDTTKAVVVIGDGSTKGGIPLAKESLAFSYVDPTYYYPGYGWDDLRFPAQGINPPGQVSDPDISAVDGMLLFDSASTEIIMGAAQMPHAWLEGSQIRPHIHWQATDGNAGNVLWRFSYDIANVNGDFSGSYTDVDTIMAASGDANTHDIGSLGYMTMTGYDLSCIIKWRIARIGGDELDTYGADARLLEFDIHYQTTSLGSGNELSK